MGVVRLGIQRPYKDMLGVEPVLTAFRHYTDEVEDVQATFNLYDIQGSALIGWYLEDVGLVTWHQADTLEEAETWIDEQCAIRVSVAEGYES